MTPDKVPTAPLKSYDAMINVAGRSAALDDYPWWVGIAVSAALVGTTDARLVHQALQTWLQGWIFERKKADPADPHLELVKQIIEGK